VCTKLAGAGRSPRLRGDADVSDLFVDEQSTQDQGSAPVAADTFRDRRSPAATVCPRSEEQAPVRAMPGRAARRGGTRAAAPDIALARLLHAMPVRHAGHPPRQATPPASVQDWSHGRAGSACSPTHRDPSCCPRVGACAAGRPVHPPLLALTTPSRRTRTKRDPHAPLFRLPNHITWTLGGQHHRAPSTRAVPMWVLPCPSPWNRVPRALSRVQTLHGHVSSDY